MFLTAIGHIVSFPKDPIRVYCTQQVLNARACLTHKYPWVKSQNPAGSNLAEDNEFNLKFNFSGRLALSLLFASVLPEYF
jgi:hypothetical protein